MARRLIHRTGAWCCYCRRPLEPSTTLTKLAATRDHIVPQCLRDEYAERSGTTYGVGRWVLCCRQCNMLKADMRPECWFWFIDHHPRWWRAFANRFQIADVVHREQVRRCHAGLGRIPTDYNYRRHATGSVPSEAMIKTLDLHRDQGLTNG